MAFLFVFNTFQLYFVRGASDKVCHILQISKFRTYASIMYTTKKENAACSIGYLFLHLSTDGSKAAAATNITELKHI